MCRCAETMKFIIIRIITTSDIVVFIFYLMKSEIMFATVVFFFLVFLFVYRLWDSHRIYQELKAHPPSPDLISNVPIS